MSNLVKIFLIGILLCNSVFILAQKDTTILFLGTQPNSKKAIDEIPDSFFGLYKDTSEVSWIEVSERGIIKTTTVLMEMTKKDVDNNEKYKVVNGWIYGVHKKDSLPCKLMDGIYTFGFPYTNEVFSFNGDYALKQMDANTYILNTQHKSDSTWQISQLYFDEKSVELYSFDQYKFAIKNDSLSKSFGEINEWNILESLHINDPEFFDYPGVQKYFKLQNVFIRKEN